MPSFRVRPSGSDEGQIFSYSVEGQKVAIKIKLLSKNKVPLIVHSPDSAFPILARPEISMSSHIYQLGNSEYI